MSELKKYEMIEENVLGDGKCRIRALIDIPKFNVKKGDVGGMIDSEENLPQDGEGWLDYSSKVLHDAMVVDGYLVNSTMRDNSILYNGNVVNSIVMGKSIFNGFVDMNDSTVKDCRFHEDTFLYESNLENTEFHSYVTMKMVKLNVQKALDIKGVIDWLNVELSITIGFMGRKSCFEDVKIQADELDTDAVLLMNHVRLKSESFIQFLSHERSSGYLTKFKGNQQNPIHFDGESLFIQCSIISGSVSLGGRLVISNSKISDMASVHMNGKVIDCTISEMAKINVMGTKRFRLESRTLSGDDVAIVTDK